MRSFENVRYGEADALRQSDVIHNYVLGGGAPTSADVPDGAKFVVFGATGNFFMRFGAGAQVPTADIADGSGSEINPAVRFIGYGVTAISLIAPAPCVVSLSFYRD